MMKDNENEKRETVADILAEYRNDADAMDRGWLYQPTAEYVRRLLDRIEAAWKREREAVEADALAVGGIVEASRHKPGNAAAMREALSDACYAMFNFLKTQSGGYEEMATALDKAKAALAEPARNCDKMPDIDNLTMHDLAKSPCKSTLEYASREELLALVRWLFAPAAERKGEGDGR